MKRKYLQLFIVLLMAFPGSILKAQFTGAYAVNPATNALVCPLVVERIRFNPARDSNGNPVPARYAWRQDFFRR